MKSLKQIMVETAARKYAKQAARKPEKPPINNRLVAMMLIPNDLVQSVIITGTESTYVPVPKGDHRPLAMLKRVAKEKKRSAAWTGLRS